MTYLNLDLHLAEAAFDRLLNGFQAQLDRKMTEIERQTEVTNLKFAKDYPACIHKHLEHFSRLSFV